MTGAAPCPDPYRPPEQLAALDRQRDVDAPLQQRAEKQVLVAAVVLDVANQAAQRVLPRLSGGHAHIVKITGVDAKGAEADIELALEFGVLGKDFCACAANALPRKLRDGGHDDKPCRSHARSTDCRPRSRSSRQ